MKIAADFDSTITAYSEFFTTIGRMLIKEGHTFYVLTGREKRQLFNEPLPEQAGRTIPILAETWGSDWYTDLLTWDLRTPEDERVGYGVTNEQKIALFKKRICEEYHIDIFFDDMGELSYSLGQKNIFTVHS